jgi:hypothetical protein
MKKLFIYAFAFASLITTKVNAQQGFSLTIKGTPQFSFLENKDDENNSAYSQKATFDANFGVGAGYNFTRNLGIGLDALYSFDGQRYELNGQKYYQDNDYVKIPLYFKYNTNPSKPVSFIGELGPQVSFLTYSSLDDNDGNKLVGNTKDRYKSATFGGMALAGVQFRLQHNLYLTTAGRFDYDFTNAENDQYAGYISGRANTYNMAAGLEVGLKYMLKK